MLMSEYRRLTLETLRGRKVRSKKPLANSLAAMPAGTVYTIVGKLAGLALRSDPCVHCGLALNIRKVNPEKVELLPPGGTMCG